MKQEAVGSPAISVIVPIYNMEKLMRKCLDSILAQTFQDYECLLIDDGSKDGSPAICDEYAAKDPRFKAFHKPNGGLSDARNYGIERAQGDYTIFFDPDDWVDVDCLTDMYAKAQETDADMVMCDLYYNDPYRQSYCKQEPTSLDHNDVLKDLIVGKVYGFTVTKLLRRTLYQQYDLQYPVGMYGCEDQYAICKLLKNNIKIAYLPNAYYHYMHFGNATQSRRYDESTYKHDLKIRDLFVELLADTPYRQLVYDKKSLAIFYRAFHFGQKSYTAFSFKERFGGYEVPITGEPILMRVLYKLSQKGFYPITRSLWGLLYDGKQFLKSLIK
jgi:glycosyltransferase involved in cell wall biosynthesis